MNRPALAKLVCVVVAMLLTACDPAVIVSQPIEMVVIQVVPVTSFTCPGSHVLSVLRAEDGRATQLCGPWGEVGTKISGCWETGHTDDFNDRSLKNGFHPICGGS